MIPHSLLPRHPLLSLTFRRPSALASSSRITSLWLVLALFSVPMFAPAATAQNLESDVVAAMADADMEETEGWTGTALLSYLGKTGNTESESLQASIAPIYGTGVWEHRLKFGTEINTENDETTAERYEAFYEGRRALSETTYLFGLVGFERDLFSAFERQWREVAGIGRVLVDTERHHLDVSLAAGARQSDLAHAPPGEDSESEFIGRFFAGYTANLSETATFSQALIVESGDLTTSYDSLTALSASLTETLALQLSYTVRHESDVPPGIDDTDTATAVAITYSF